MGDERQVRVALARWQVIAAATDKRLGPNERSGLVAEIAGEVHHDADGRPMRVTARTVYRPLARSGVSDGNGAMVRSRVVDRAARRKQGLLLAAKLLLVTAVWHERRGA